MLWRTGFEKVQAENTGVIVRKWPNTDSLYVQQRTDLLCYDFDEFFHWRQIVSVQAHQLVQGRIENTNPVKHTGFGDLSF